MLRYSAPLLLLYVLLDFSNPLMPGAVSFDPWESTEGVSLERLRVGSPSAGVGPAPPASGVEPASKPGLVRPRMRLRTPSRAWLVQRRRAHAAYPDPSATPDDH